MKHTHKHVRRETKKENKNIPPRSKVTPKLLKFSTSFPLTRSKSSAFTLNKANVEWPTSTFASTTNFPTSWAVACAFNYQNLVFRSHLKVFCLFVFNIKKKERRFTITGRRRWSGSDQNIKLFMDEMMRYGLQ